MKKLNSIHYGWVIVATGTLCIFASLGLGRFALGMLLPSMGESLELSYAQMGYISTGNFIGYLVSVIAGGYLSVRLGARAVISASLLLVGITMMLIGSVSGFIPVMVLYVLTGIGSGGANIPMMALVSAWFSRAGRGRATGFVVIGSGFAIILAGRLIPYINSTFGAIGWRVNWLILGGVVIMAALVCYKLLQNKPEDMGLTPHGSEQDPPRQFSDSNVSLYKSRIIYHLGFIYFLFGFTYVIYVTFVVTSLVQDRGFTEQEAGALWSWVGILSLLSGPIFGALSDKLGRKAGLMAVFTLQGFSYALVASGLPGIFLYLSIGAFGIAAWSIPSILAATVGDHLGAARTPQAFGIITFIFAIGQISGPAIAGLMADRTGSFAISFILAASMAALAVGVSAMLKPHNQGD